jgi:hypothetical protein
LAAAVFAFFNFYSAICSFFIALAISLKVFFLYGQLNGFISSTDTTPSSGYITAVFLSFSASSSNLASAIFFYQILFTFLTFFSFNYCYFKSAISSITFILAF